MNEELVYAEQRGLDYMKVRIWHYPDGSMIASGYYLDGEDSVSFSLYYPVGMRMSRVLRELANECEQKEVAAGYGQLRFMDFEVSP